MPRRSLPRTKTSPYTCYVCLAIDKAASLTIQELEERPWCICYAITDYLVQVYGVDAVIYGEKVALRYKAHRYIESKLQELVEAPYTYFQEAHAMAVLGVEYDASSYDHMQEQRARHIWLDSLIQELECST